MSRELIVRPLGLVTRPNIYGQYPEGALSLAQNLVMRAPGILEAAPATALGLSWGGANNVVHDIVPMTGAVISTTENAGSWILRRNGTSYASVLLVAAQPTYSTTGACQRVVARGRVFLNTVESGVLVIDDPDSAPSSNSLRLAGLPQPSLDNFGGNTTAPIALVGPNVTAGYTFVVRRVFSDGYEIASEPFPLYTFYNGSSQTFDVTAIFRCGFGTGMRAGDIVEMYRTNIVSSSTAQTDPGTSCQLVASYTLTATDISNTSVVMRDSTQPGPLGVTAGKALYTNPGQEGATQVNLRPPLCKAMAFFKNYMFYGNVAELPILRFTVPAAISRSNNTGFTGASWRTRGIGIRAITGTVTSGSPTVTGISAADMVGLKVGQRYFSGVGGAAFGSLPVPEIITVGANSITMSANATASGTGITVTDVLVIDSNGGMPIYDSPQVFLANFFSWGLNNYNYRVSTSENAALSQDPTTGVPKIEFLIQPAQWNRVNSNNTMTVRATNGANYDPPLPEYTDASQTLSPKTYANVLQWSKDSQPEHCPPPNTTQVGGGTIIALEPTRDALWIFCTDGLYRLSGAGGQWRVDTVDTTLVLSAPRASCVLRDVVYCYTNQGFGRVTDAGFEPLSERIVGDLLPGAEYAETASIIVERNEAEDEIVIRLDATQVYVYNVRENAYTTLLEPDVTCMAYVRYPVSGAACLAFGRSPSGLAPRYELWNSPANWLAGTARFQPVFAGDPFSAKQWIDGTFVFDASAAGASLTPSWNGTNQAAGPLVNAGRYYNEARATFGVPRAVGLGHTLAPGFSFGTLGFASKFLALSLRYRQFGEQNLKR